MVAVSIARTYDCRGAMCGELSCGAGRVPCARALAHTYLGQGFLKRAFMLLAGILVNILTGFAPYEHLFHCGCPPCRWIPTCPVRLTGGLLPPRRVSRPVMRYFRLTVSHVPLGWMSTMPSARPPVRTILLLSIERDGKQCSTSVALKENERFGRLCLYAGGSFWTPSPQRASPSLCCADGGGRATSAPATHTMESCRSGPPRWMGISVMSSQAAAAGPITFLSFAALICSRWSFMNLLPIPPLDGEQADHRDRSKIAGRRLPLKGQTIT